MKKKVKTIPSGNALLTAFQSHNTTTANGAVSHSTTSSGLVDLFGKGGAMRAQPEAEAVNLFVAAYKEDKTLALKVLFYLADVREGQGERKFFRTCYAWLAKNDSAVATKLLQYVPEYTRYDNVLETLEGTPLEKAALAFIARQLKTDSQSEDSPTLCAKWAPSEQASSATTRRLAAKLRAHMHMSPKSYRKMLSALRERINVVERLMCTSEWKGINYEAVPSKASTLYRKAFSKRDPDGYAKFIGAVQKGTKKINASVLYPYDLVRTYIQGDVYGRRDVTASPDATIEVQWKALPDYLKDNPQNIMVIADVSGSMSSGGNGNVRPIDVAVSLAIYGAERSKGVFQNNFMIFSNESKLLTLQSGASLSQNVATVLGNRDVANTNLQSAFDLILAKGLRYKVPQSDMPTTLLIISDMQFDQAEGFNQQTNLEVIRQKYSAAGYKMPAIVFWNVNSHADVPAKLDDKGVCLVSGASPSIFKSALSRKIVTPYETMVNTVNVERYSVICV